MAEHGDGRLARRQTVLSQQVGDGAIRPAFLPQLNDDFFRRDQILELLWPARRKFSNCLADFGWIKRVHRVE